MLKWLPEAEKKRAWRMVERNKVQQRKTWSGELEEGEEKSARNLRSLR